MPFPGIELERISVSK